MRNFDRQYLLTAGVAGGQGFELGGGENPLHIRFSVEKADTKTANTAKVSVWNLSPEHLAILNKKDCKIELKAGYGDNIHLIFSGTVTYAKTITDDSADVETEIELTDSRTEVRDTYVAVGYNGSVNCKTLIEETARQMGLTVSFSHNATFAEIANGYSYVGQAKNILTKACNTSGLSWSINNGILQVKKPNDTMSREVYELSPEAGLVGSPQKVQISDKTNGGGNQYGYDCEFLMNAAIGLNDYVYLNSRYAKGYFRVYSIRIEGDNYESSWTCSARLLEVK